jgi:hypothetical protein
MNFSTLCCSTKNENRNDITKNKSSQSETVSIKKYENTAVANVENKAMSSEVEAAKLYFREYFIDN